MNYQKPQMDVLVLGCDERFAASISTASISTDQIYFEEGTMDNEFNTENN